MRGRLLAVAYALALILPGLLVLLGPRPVAGFLLYACGLIALASLMMLSLQFVTSGRFERLAAPFGLDVIMGFHRFAGRTVVFAIAAHVLLSLLLAVGSDLSEVPAMAATFLTSERLATGFIALVLVSVLVWSAARRDRIGLKYEWWRLSHGIGALVLLIVASHHAWTNAVFLQSPGVAVLAVGGIVVAFASFGVVYGVRAVKARNADWRVERVRPLGAGLHELTLSRATSSAFSFQAGQFAWVTFNRRHPVTDHPFSIASAPGELPTLRLIIKANGDFTREVGSILAGTPAYLDGPHGSFIVSPEAKSIVLIAGGVGVAPILSILQSLADDRYGGPMALLVATRYERDQLFVDQVEELSGQLNVRTMLVVENPSQSWHGERGRIDEPKLMQLLSGLPLDRAEVLMCGPLPMMDAASRLLLKLGLSAKQIRYERFDYHEGSDTKSRAIRQRFLLLLGTAAGLVLLTASAGAYFS